MIYLLRLNYWWTNRIVRFYATVIILISAIATAFYDPITWFFVVFWVGINLAWSSSLNPAWRHTFHPEVEWKRVNKYVWEAEDYDGRFVQVKMYDGKALLQYYSFMYLDNPRKTRHESLIEAMIVGAKLIAKA